jgi:hypothetical protein
MNHCQSYCLFLVQFAGVHQEVLDDRTNRQRREKCQGSDNQHHARKQDDKRTADDGERAGARRHRVLGHQPAGQRDYRN